MISCIKFFVCVNYECFFLNYIHISFAVPLGPASFGLWTALCILSAPVAVVKSGISLVQLYAACQNVTSIDMSEREKDKAK